ncbi:hypothetical protein [Cellulomonas aerilata]|uniref:Uncharacterized protein n=1 Tax=Cellulomonas aerilata TaxID=515326 RepID=A0A512DAS9_9CELL|nr:hypothetical protein [Cellulomonas aerilata]GEO33574.1 hypothetical protein CAE01nite_12990 [Cellulomonas aerilata]
MGFLDKAKAAANDLTAKVDTALAGSGLGTPGGSAGADAERYLRDLGVLAFLDAQGRPTPEVERARVLGALRDLEARGAIHGLTLHTAPPPPPGGGPAAQSGGPAAQGGGPAAQGGGPSAHTPPPPPPGGAAPAYPPPPPPADPAAPPPPGRTAPPPPPSWLA